VLGVPASKPAVIVPLVSSAAWVAWVFCVTSAVFPELPDVGETDFEAHGVGVEIPLVSPLRPLSRVRGQSLRCNDSAYCNLTLTHSVTKHIWNA